MTFNTWYLIHLSSDLIQESPAFDLIHDCFRFVTRHFGIIDASASHIYHSAIVLAPETSIIRKLYGSYAQPFTRVVRGVSMSWDRNIAATSFPFGITSVVWSPCNKLIAISGWNAARVDILNSATLQRLRTLPLPWRVSEAPIRLIFSPDTRMLAWLGRVNGVRSYSPLGIVSWDLQTGGVVNSSEADHNGLGGTSIAYSTSGKMIAILHPDLFMSPSTISIYNVVSGVYTRNAYYCAKPVCDIWTHGESLWTATVERPTLTVREVGFTPGATCVDVRTLSIPGNNSCNLCHLQVHFLPASCRLALVCTNRLLVWSLQDPHSLLYHIDINRDTPVTFSSDGRFIAYTSRLAEAHIWKETSTGYTLQAKFPTTDTLHLSPNGESLVMVGRSAIQLWNVKTITTTTPTEVPHHTKDFLLDFFLDRPLAVFMRQGDNTATVLDLKSGLPQLTIQTSVKVHGLRVIGDTIVVISTERAISWKLPGRISSPDGRIGVEHSTQIINLDAYHHASTPSVIAATISLDFCYIATLTANSQGCTLYLHDGSSGRFLTDRIFKWGGGPLWFAPDGFHIFCFLREGGVMMKIAQAGLLAGPVMTPTADIEAGSWGCPWGTPSGRRVTDDGWTLGADKRRLLMLPPPWQSHPKKRVWNGQFLVLLHGSLPEPVILELEP